MEYDVTIQIEGTDVVVGNKRSIFSWIITGLLEKRFKIILCNNQIFI